MQVLATGPFSKREHVKTRIRSPWFFLLMLLLPCAVYLLGRIFEQSITKLIIPFFPVENDKGYLFYLDFVRLCLNEVLWLSFFCLIAWWLVAVPGRLTKRFFQIHASYVYAALLAVIFFCVTSGISWFALEAFPNSSDEYAYLIQAETLANGEFAHAAPDYSDAYHHNHIAVKDGVRVGRFPPGWPLLLSTAYVLHISPWLINPLLGTISLLLVFAFAKRFYDRHTALWSLLITALSGYFIFNSASYFSHVACFLAILGFVWMFRLYVEHGKITALLVAGFCLGLVAIIRYYTAFLVFIPFAGWFFYHHKLKSITLIFVIAAGTLPWLMFLFWYNFSLTGNAFTPVTVWAYADEQLGFVKGHTVMKGFEHLIRRMFMLMYWCSPGVLLLYIIFVWKKVRTSVERWTHPEDYLFIVLLLGHFVYYQIGGNQYGPRFLLEAFPFVAIFIVRMILGSRFSPAYAAILVAGLVFSVMKLPMIVSREAEVVDERQDLYDLVAEESVHNAVVVVESPTSPIRPMPIGDLTRNGMQLDGDVIYIQDVPEKEEVVKRYGETRTFYRYVRNPDQLHGKLIPMKSSHASRE